MKKKFLAVLATGIFLLFCTAGGAFATIVEYDLSSASLQSLNASYVDPNFSASSLNAVGLTGNAFGNHFYFSGWDNSVNINKYIGFSIDSAQNYSLGALNFSVEQTFSSPANGYLRSSLDGFTTDLWDFSWSGGLVTDATADLGALSSLTGLTEFRWYFTTTSSSNRVGLANHELGAAGGGMSDVGLDVELNPAPVPEPSTMLLLGSGLVGLAWYGRKRKNV